MTIRQKYILYAVLSIAFNLLLIYLAASTNISGLSFIILLISIIVISYLSIALFISVFAKDPSKLFKSVVTAIFGMFTPF